MTGADFERFREWFDLLAITHRLGAPEDLKAKMAAEYFDTLRSFPLEAVEIAYQKLRRTSHRWPVPAAWIEAMPPDLGLMRMPWVTPEEQAEVEDAERCGYQRPGPCQCAVCSRAGTTHLASRYVPRLDREGDVIRRRHPGKPKAVTLGRWLHGDELRQWYQARGAFYQAMGDVQQQVIRDRQAPTTVEGRMMRLVTAARVATAGVSAGRE